jgi:hypothetical protein
MIVMYDSITPDTVPPNPQAVAGYVGGSWPDYNDLVRIFPHAYHLSIAVNAGEDAACLDVETGDASPDQAPAWIERQLARGVWRPCIYANRSVWDGGMYGSLQHYGARIRRWVAEWTYQAHIPVGYDACQWTDRAWGRNLDESLCWDTFFQGAHPPLPTGVEIMAITAAYNTARQTFDVFVEAKPQGNDKAGEVFHTWQGADGIWKLPWTSLGVPGK